MKSNEIHIPSTQTNENCLGLAANKVLNGRMAEWLTKQVLVVDSYFHYDLMPILNGNQTFLEVFFLFGSCKSLQAVRSPMKLQDILNMTMGGPASSNDFLHQKQFHDLEAARCSTQPQIVRCAISSWLLHLERVLPNSTGSSDNQDKHNFDPFSFRDDLR